MENQNGNDKPRLLNSIKFSLGIISIVCGIFFILIIFYQFWTNFTLNQEDMPKSYQIMISLFHPEIIHPEIFIPEGIILFVVGLDLLIILRQQIINKNENKHLDHLSIGLVVCIIFFTLLFIIGHLIAHYYLGRYEIFNPLFMMIIAFLIIFTSIFILLFGIKITGGDNKTIKGKDKQHKRLLDNNFVDYRILTAIFLIIFIFLILIGPIFTSTTPPTNTKIYWEDRTLPNKVVLPGMNAIYNLTIESQGGIITFKYIIKESCREGIWNVSPNEIIIEPNEKKIITFINLVPLNATECQYRYSFYLVDLSDWGPSGIRGVEQIQTEVTHNISYYNSSQTKSETFLSVLGIGKSWSDFRVILLYLAFLIFIAWIVITVFFLKNKKRAPTRNK